MITYIHISYNWLLKFIEPYCKILAGVLLQGPQILCDVSLWSRFFWNAEPWWTVLAHPPQVFAPGKNLALLGTTWHRGCCAISNRRDSYVAVQQNGSRATRRQFHTESCLTTNLTMWSHMERQRCVEWLQYHSWCCPWLISLRSVDFKRVLKRARKELIQEQHKPKWKMQRQAEDP